jgi:hypothetical protein
MRGMKIAHTKPGNPAPQPPRPRRRRQLGRFDLPVVTPSASRAKLARRLA